MVRFAQPHALFRRGASLLLSVALMLLFGVRNPVIVVLGALFLWAPVSIPVNMYCVYMMPLGLRPWVPRGKKPFESTVPQIFESKNK